MDRQRLIVYGIIGVLVLAVLGVLGYSQLSGPSPVSPFAPAQPVSIGGLQAGVAAQPIQVELFQDPRFQALDRSLIEQGRLPVPPPAQAGRPDLF